MMSNRTPVLILIQGGEPGARWKLQETCVTIIGRSSRNQVSLVSPSVSRHHCEISCINGLWRIADLNSKKGTYVNGRKIMQREVLEPGDIIRMSTNMFRFDLVDETVKEDDALVAIRDASLNVEATIRGETPDALEGMRLRSQLSAAEEEEERTVRRKFLQNAAFVGAVAAVVALMVGAALVAAHSGERRVRAKESKWAREAHQAYEENAQKLAEAEPEQRLAAVPILREITEQYAGTDAARKAAALSQRLEGEVFEYELARVRDSEGEGDYKDALDRTSRLIRTLADPTVKDFLETRQRYTQQLVRTAFREIQKEAIRLEEEENDPEAAIALYRHAVERIGLRDVVRAANARIRAIEQRYPGMPETTPHPQLKPDS